MRIGLLPFGSLDPTPLAEYFRSVDVDVISAEQPVTTLVLAGEEAARIARADCDGVALLLGPDMDASQVGKAALHLPSPLLLTGPVSAAFGAAAGVLAEIGVSFDRYPWEAPEPPLAAISAWLTANAKRERQRGIEAALKLHGQRLSLGPGVCSGDPAQVQRQFGVTLVGSGEIGDFSHPDGDLNAALTAQLLHLISGEEVAALPMDEAVPDGATGARLVRIRGRYLCFLLHGASSPRERAGALLAGDYYTALGNHIAALRAACETLDVAVDATLTH